MSLGGTPPVDRDLEWPKPPHEAAFYGLAGDFVHAIEPHTESDTVAILVQLLVAYGNLVGRSPYWIVEQDMHHVNLFAALVGLTSKGRKGTSWGHVRKILSSIDHEWANRQILSGMSSGEGLISAVCDPVMKKGKGPDDEDIVVAEGADDKRVLVVESEFASTLRVLKRDTNILSPILRQAWDSGCLQTLTKNSPLRATGAHVSVIGHVTRDELVRTIDATEYGNGFANRFLWICVKRSKVLPEGGKLHTVDFGPLTRRMSEAVKFGRRAGVIERDHDAAALWGFVYEELSEGKPGILGAVTSRAEAQTMRLATVFALLDKSHYIEQVHLRAALALWEFSERCATFIFGDAIGDPRADVILKKLRVARNGLTRTEIRDLFARNVSAALINLSLTFLKRNKLASMKARKTGGRSAEVWFATTKHGQSSASAVVRSLNPLLSYPTHQDLGRNDKLRPKREKPESENHVYDIDDKRGITRKREGSGEPVSRATTETIDTTEIPSSGGEPISQHPDGGTGSGVDFDDLFDFEPDEGEGS